MANSDPVHPYQKHKFIIVNVNTKTWIYTMQCKRDDSCRLQAEFKAETENELTMAEMIMQLQDEMKNLKTRIISQ